MEKIKNHSSLILLTCLVFSFTVRAQKGKPANRSTHSYSSGSSFLSVNDDSSYTPMRTLIVYKDGPLYNITMEGEKVLDLFVDGRKIPADSFYVYDAVIKRLNEQIKKDRIQAKLDMEQAMKDQVQAMKDQAQAMRDQEQAMRDQEQAARDKIHAEMDAVQAERDKIRAERDRSQAEEEAREAKVQAERDQLEAKEEAREAKEQAEQERKEAERDKAEAERDKIEAQRDKIQAERDQEEAKRDKIQAEEDKALLKSIIREVVKDGLAPDEKSVTSLIFDKDELIVNGKKASDELQRKYRTKFLIQSGYRISYRR